MLLLRNARTTTYTQDDVISHVAHHATRYDITPATHRFFAENPRDHHDIRHDFGSLVPPDGDTYFEFDLPPYVRLGQRLLLDQSGVRTAGVLVQRYAREDLAGIEYLVCALPYLMQRRARKRTTQLLRATFLLELLGNLHAQLWEILRDGVELALNELYDYTDMIYAPVAANLSPTRCFDMVYIDEA